jgi:hypothetical protein
VDRVYGILDLDKRVDALIVEMRGSSPKRRSKPR